VRKGQTPVRGRVEQPYGLVVQEHPDAVPAENGPQGDPEEIEERDHEHQHSSPPSFSEHTDRGDDPGDGDDEHQQCNDDQDDRYDINELVRNVMYIDGPEAEDHIEETPESRRDDEEEE
jgi:hypothetical protein